MMNKDTTIRLQLKRALLDLEAAREKHRAGCAVRVPPADIRMLELRVNRMSDVFTKLMEKLISANSTAPRQNLG